MSGLIRFMQMLCGTFNNDEQCRQEADSGEQIHPHAKHVIGICNERMCNLPPDFTDYFVIEESYFAMGDRTIEKHYLFLYEEIDDGRIRLSSYDPPAGIPRESLTNEDTSLRLDYSEIRISPRFTPLVLQEIDDGFSGANVSQFSPDTLFKFSLRVTPNALYVTELLERDGESIAGFETPTVYIKAS